MRSVRSLHLDAGRDMSGGQWQVLRLLRGLRKRGHETMLLAREGAPLLLAARRDGFEVQELSRRRVSRESRVYDLVHAHDARSHSLAVFSRAPLIVSRRVAFPLKRTWLSRWKYGRAARFIAVSQHVARVLSEAGVPAQRIEVVYDGVPLLPLALPIEPLVLTPPKEVARAQAIANEAGIALTVSHNLEHDLPSASAMLYLSNSEGLGSAVLLAMSACVPVIASDLPAIREMIIPGDNGLLAPARDSDVVDMLKTLIEDEALRRRLAAAARLTVEQRFTEDRMVDATIAVYRKALDA